MGILAYKMAETEEKPKKTSPKIAHRRTKTY